MLIPQIMVILITKGAVSLRSSVALILIQMKNEINTNDFSDTAVLKQTSRRDFGKYQIIKNQKMQSSKCVFVCNFNVSRDLFEIHFK